MNKFDITIALVGGAIGIAVGAMGLGYGIGQRKKLSDISARLGKAVDELSEDIDVEVKDSVVKAAVEKAAKKAAEAACRDAVNEIEYDLQRDISTQVKTAVEASYSDIKGSVRSEIERKVKKLDINSLKDEVIEAAKKEALEKLQSSMDDILEGFNNNLKNVTQIYQSMAEKLSGGSAKDLKLSFG